MVHLLLGQVEKGGAKVSDQIAWQKYVIKDDLPKDGWERKIKEEEKAWMEELQQRRKYKRGPRRRADHIWTEKPSPNAADS